MIKLFRDYFINKKLSSLGSFSKTINIQKNLENPKRIVVLYNEKLNSFPEVFSVRKTIENHYPESSIEFVFFTYHPLYKDIFKFKNHYENIPAPSKFFELDALKKIKNSGESIDMLFDITSFDLRLRKMIVRTLKPQFAVSLYEDGAESDYNILFKNSAPDLFTIFRALNFSVEKSSLKDNIADISKNTKTNDFEVILTGSSRKIKNDMKKAFKEQKRFLLIEDLPSQLDLFSVTSIRKCKEVIFDDNTADSVRFIKNLDM